MEREEPAGLHLPTIDDIRRLLACVNALHAAKAFARTRELAGCIVRLLDGDAAIIGVAVADHWVTVGATVGTELHAADPDADVAAANRRSRPPTPDGIGHDVVLIPPTISPNGTPMPAIIHSVYHGDGPATAISAWRMAAFEPRHDAILKVLHPAVAWAIEPSLVYQRLPVGAEAVLELMLTGLREKEIAARLGRSAHTIHGHVKRVYRHFAVSSRPELLVRLNKAPGDAAQTDVR